MLWLVVACGSFGGVFACYHLSTGYQGRAVSSASALVVALVLALALRAGASVRVVMALAGIYATGVTLFALASPLYPPTDFVWSLLVPLFITFAGGSRVAARLLPFFFALAALIVIHPAFAHRDFWAQHELAFRFLGMLALVSAVAYLYEYRRSRAHAEYRALFDEMSDGFLLHETVFDEGGRPVDHRILEVNRSLERLCGVPAADLVGKKLSEAWPNAQQRLFDLYAKVASSGDAARSEIFAQELRKHLEIIVYRPLNGRVATILVDKTEEKQLKEQLFHTQKMEAVATLAGGVAHDMNNVLAVVLGLASVLRLELGSGHPQYKDVEDIIAAAKRGKALINDLVGFARKGRSRREQVQVNRMVTELRDMLSHSLPKNIELDIALEGDLALVEADSGQLAQCAMDLCINARDALKDGGSIVVTTDNVVVPAQNPIGLGPGSYVRLSVKDNGTGMDEETARRAVEPFFTTKEVGEGTGLGLSIAYGIAENHGGALEIKSELGTGSTISLWLPVMKAANITELETSNTQSAAQDRAAGPRGPHRQRR